MSETLILENPVPELPVPEIPISSAPELFSIKSFSQSLFNQEFFNIVHSNLKGIKAVPTYKKMCELLQFKPTATKESRKKQFQIWSAYFVFTQKNNSFSIKSLCSEKKTKENILNVLMDDYFNYLFISFLNSYYSFSNQTNLIISNSALYESLGLINPDFKNFNPSFSSKDNINVFCAYLESQVLLSSHNKTFLTNFKKQINLKHTIALKSLEKQIQIEEDKANGSYEADKFLQQQTDYFNSFTDKNNPFSYQLTNEQKKNFIYFPTYTTLSSFYDFFSHSLPNLKYKINKLLDIMERNNIIISHKILIACVNGEKSILPLSEFSKYLSAVQNTCKSFNITSVADLPHSPSSYAKYYSLLNSNIKQKLGYDFIYPALNISFTASDISFDSFMVSKFLKKSNSIFLDSLLNNFNSRLPSNTPTSANKIKALLFDLISQEFIPNSFNFIDLSILNNSTNPNKQDSYSTLSIPDSWVSIFSDSSSILQNYQPFSLSENFSEIPFSENFSENPFSENINIIENNTENVNENNITKVKLKLLHDIYNISFYEDFLQNLSEKIQNFSEEEFNSFFTENFVY